MATTCEPAAGSTDALTMSTDDVPVALSCRLVCLEPLDTGSKSKRWRHATSSSVGKSNLTQKIGTNRYRM